MFAIKQKLNRSKFVQLNLHLAVKTCTTNAPWNRIAESNCLSASQKNRLVIVSSFSKSELVF